MGEGVQWVARMSLEKDTLANNLQNLIGDRLVIQSWFNVDLSDETKYKNYRIIHTSKRKNA